MAQSEFDLPPLDDAELDVGGAPEDLTLDVAPVMPTAGGQASPTVDVSSLALPQVSGFDPRNYSDVTLRYIQAQQRKNAEAEARRQLQLEMAELRATRALIRAENELQKLMLPTEARSARGGDKDKPTLQDRMDFLRMVNFRDEPEAMYAPQVSVQDLKRTEAWLKGTPEQRNRLILDYAERELWKTLPATTKPAVLERKKQEFIKANWQMPEEAKALATIARLASLGGVVPGEAVLSGFGELANTLKAISDLGGADNPVSRYLGGLVELANQAKGAKEFLRRQELDKKNEGASAAARFINSALSELSDPVGLAGKAAGTVAGSLIGAAPFVATFAGLGASLPVAIGLGQLAYGAAAGIGAVKGNIYENIMNLPEAELEKDRYYAELRANGASPENARKAVAALRQSYGLETAPETLAAALIGMAVSKFGGAEKAVRDLAKIAVKDRAFMNEVARAGLLPQLARYGFREAITEVPQEGAETALANIGAARGGAPIPVMRGVAEAAGAALPLALAVGGLGGAATVAARGPEPRFEEAEILDRPTLAERVASGRFRRQQEPVIQPEARRLGEQTEEERRLLRGPIERQPQGDDFDVFAQRRPAGEPQRATEQQTQEPQPDTESTLDDLPEEVRAELAPKVEQARAQRRQRQAAQPEQPAQPAQEQVVRPEPQPVQPVQQPQVQAQAQESQAVAATAQGDVATPQQTNWISGNLQNRQRNTPASIMQMQGVANNPDYRRLGVTDQMEVGAPTVAGLSPAEAAFGRSSTGVLQADGRDMPFTYAVVEADRVLTSNNVNGNADQRYADPTVPGARVIIGNGRMAGLKEAYARGTARNYRAALEADAASFGVDPAAIRAMQKPVLVKVIHPSQVTPDLADASNVPTQLGMSAVERAKNDVARMDLSRVTFDEEGNVSMQSIRNFVSEITRNAGTELAELLGTDGAPTQQARDRYMAALFQKAYGSDGLTEIYAQAIQSTGQNIIKALARLAPEAVGLEGAGEYDVRPLIAEASIKAINTLRSGRSTLREDARQTSLLDSAVNDRVVNAIVEMYDRNSRSYTAIYKKLSNVVRALKAEAEKLNTASLFGYAPIPAEQIILSQLEGNNDTGRQATLELGSGGTLPEAGDGRAPPGRAGQGADEGVGRAHSQAQAQVAGPAQATDTQGRRDTSLEALSYEEITGLPDTTGVQVDIVQGVADGKSIPALGEGLESLDPRNRARAVEGGLTKDQALNEIATGAGFKGLAPAASRKRISAKTEFISAEQARELLEQASDVDFLFALEGRLGRLKPEQQNQGNPEIPIKKLDWVIEELNPRLQKVKGGPKEVYEALRVMAFDLQAQRRPATPRGMVKRIRRMLTMPDGRLYDPEYIGHANATVETITLYHEMEAHGARRVAARMAEALTRLRKDSVWAVNSVAIGITESELEHSAILAVFSRYSIQPRVRNGVVEYDVVEQAADNDNVPPPADPYLVQRFLEHARKDDGRSLKYALQQAYKDFVDDIQQRMQLSSVSGLVKFEQSDRREDAVRLNRACAGTVWCTGKSEETAAAQLGMGDFYIYYEAGLPQVAFRMYASDVLAEPPRGTNSDQSLTARQMKIAEEVLRSGQVPGGEDFVKEYDMLNKIAAEKSLEGLTDEEVDRLAKGRRLSAIGHSRYGQGYPEKLVLLAQEEAEKRKLRDIGVSIADGIMTVSSKSEPSIEDTMLIIDKYGKQGLKGIVMNGLVRYYDRKLFFLDFIGDFNLTINDLREAPEGFGFHGRSGGEQIINMPDAFKIGDIGLYNSTRVSLTAPNAEVNEVSFWNNRHWTASDNAYVYIDNKLTRHLVVERSNSKSILLNHVGDVEKAYIDTSGQYRFSGRVDRLQILNSYSIENVVDLSRGKNIDINITAESIGSIELYGLWKIQEELKGSGKELDKYGSLTVTVNGKVLFDSRNGFLNREFALDGTDLEWPLQAATEGGVIKGLYSPVQDKIYLVHDALRKGEAVPVWVHEAAHMLESELGPGRFAELANQVRSWARSPEKSLERRVYDEAIRMTVAAEGKDVDHELVAYAAMAASRAGVTPSVHGNKVQQFMAALRDLFAKLIEKVFGARVELKPQDLVDMAFATYMIRADRAGRSRGATDDAALKIPDAEVADLEATVRREGVAEPAVGEQVATAQEEDRVERDGAVVKERSADPRESPNYRGTYLPSTGQIVLDASLKKQDVIPVLLHEIWHKAADFARSGALLTEAEFTAVVRRVKQWKKEPAGSLEREIYEAAHERAMGDANYEEELVAYAIEEAVSRGVEPSQEGVPPRNKVQAFLDAIAELARKLLEALIGAPMKRKLTAQELVSVAYGLAGRIISDERVSGAKRRPDPDEKAITDAIDEAFGVGTGAVLLGDNTLIIASDVAAFVGDDARPSKRQTKGQTIIDSVNRVGNTAVKVDTLLNDDERIASLQDRVIHAYFDRQHTLQLALREMFNSKDEVGNPLWSAVKRYTPRRDAMVSKLKREHVEPMRQAAAELGKKLGLEPAEVVSISGHWALYRHGLDMNRVLAERYRDEYQMALDELASEIASKGPRGATRALKNKVLKALKVYQDTLNQNTAPDSLARLALGMTDAQLKAKMAEIERQMGSWAAEMKRIADSHVALNRAMLTLLANENAIDPADAAYLRSIYPRYMPIRLRKLQEEPFAEFEEAGGLSAGVGKRMILRAKGFPVGVEALVQDPVETMAELIHAAAAKAASVQVNRAIVEQTLEANMKADLEGRERSRIFEVKPFNTNDIDPGSSRGSFKVILGYNANGTPEWWQGQINSEVVAKAVRSSYEDQPTGEILKAIGLSTRLASRLLTQGTLVFPIINSFARDYLQERAVNIYARDFRFDDPEGRAVTVSGKDVFRHYAKGTKDYLNSLVAGYELAKMLYFQKIGQPKFALTEDMIDLANRGGLSTFVDIFESGREDLRKELNVSESYLRGVGSKLLNSLSVWNAMFDYATVHRSYRAFLEAARENGLTIDEATKNQAAFHALDLMNFRNRGALIGDRVRALFMFPGATLESGRQIIRTGKAPRGPKVLLGMVAAFILIDAITAAITDALSGEDEDDKLLGSEIDRQSRMKMERSILIPLVVKGDPQQDSYLAIPVGYGLVNVARNIAWNLRRQYYGLQDGKTTAAEIAKSTIRNISPVGSSEVDFSKDPMLWAVYAFGPNAPLVQAAVGTLTNKSVLGGSIAKENRDPKKPAYQQARPETEKAWVEASEYLYGIGIDIAPEYLKLWIGKQFPGPVDGLIRTAIDDRAERGYPTTWLQDQAWMRIVGFDRLMAADATSAALMKTFYEKVAEAERLESKARDQGLTRLDRGNSAQRAAHLRRELEKTTLTDQEKQLVILANEYRNKIKVAARERNGKLKAVAEDGSEVEINENYFAKREEMAREFLRRWQDVSAKN